MIQNERRINVYSFNTDKYSYASAGEDLIKHPLMRHSRRRRLVNEFLYGNEAASLRPRSCPDHQACWELNGCGPCIPGQLPLATSPSRTGSPSPRLLR